MAIALKMTSRGTRQRQRDKRQGKIGSSPAFCRWMVWGSTRTVAGNTWCYERTAEWQAVSPPPRCQSPVWLLSVCHSLTQPTHSPVPSLPDFFGSPSLRPLSPRSLDLSPSLFFYLSFSPPFFQSLFFSWLAFKLVGPVTATDVRICLRKYFFGPKYAHCYSHPRCPPKFHARCSLLCVMCSGKNLHQVNNAIRGKLKWTEKLCTRAREIVFFSMRIIPCIFKRKYFKSRFHYINIISVLFHDK